MLSAEEILKKIEDTTYWDSLGTKLSCEYFSDEVTLVYDGGSNLRPILCELIFTTCFFTSFEHYWGEVSREKPIRERTLAQMDFFMENVEVEIVHEYGLDLYKFSIHMPPMRMVIICKDLKINGVSVNE
jgi:hypothetical protein